MIRKSTLYKPWLLISFALLTMVITQEAHSQTVYKQQKGVFTGLPTFSAQGGTGNFELLIGPWIGYRLDENLDIMLHAEYFSDEAFDFSLINIGLTAGYTTHTPSFMWRNEIRLYRAFNLSTSEAASPKAFTLSGFTTGYYPIDVSNKITFLPYAGLFAFAGNKEMPPTRTNYLSGHQDGFVFGPRFGFDVNIAFTPSFTWTLGAGYAVALTDQPNQTYDGLILTLQFNF
ncbi:hypothetical protein [Rhodohalobacter sp.]|uniref:hypothetical protein n=1 Tax=Rhodohalobacter sp. TaxID=1974210 RepID=UPI002ACD34C4|nr:hypothetical protein [Rhodohalobacter sp.]